MACDIVEPAPQSERQGSRRATAEQNMYGSVISEDSPAGRDKGSPDPASTRRIFKSGIWVKLWEGSLQIASPLKP